MSFWPVSPLMIGSYGSVAATRDWPTLAKDGRSIARTLSIKVV